MKLVYKVVGKVLSVDTEKKTTTFIPAMQAKYGTQEELDAFIKANNLSEGDYFFATKGWQTKWLK